MLFCTSLVAVVGIGDQPTLSPRRLRITNTKRQSTICELTFPTAVLRVLLNRRHLVVVLEEQIYVYDISNMKLLQTIDTAPNPKAVAALTASSDNSHCYLIYPSGAPSATRPGVAGSVNLANSAAGAAANVAANTQRSVSPPNAGPGSGNISGELQVFDCKNLRPVNVVSAHKGPVVVVGINSEGTMMATASGKGTIIRVFSIPSGKLLYQFRRGSRPSTVHSICFNLSSTLLCVSSASQTVHIFKLARSQDQPIPHLKPGPQPEPEETRTRLSADGSTDEITNTRDEETNGIGSQPYEIPDADHQDLDDDQDDEDEVPKAFISQSKAPKQSRFGFDGYLGTKRQELGKQVAGYLPKGVTEMWETKQRDFAFFKLPAEHSTKSVVAMSKNSQYVYAVTSEGYFYQYLINLVTGGECELVKQYSLTTSDD